MKEISFAELFSGDVNVTSIAAVERRWKNGNLNQYPLGRGENILSLTLRGNKEIFTESDSAPLFSLSSPSVIFISQGAPYTSHTIAQSEGEMGHTVCVRFKLFDRSGNPLRIKEKYLAFSGEGLIEAQFYNVLKSFLSHEGNIIQTKAYFLSLLCSLYEKHHSFKIDDEFSIIKPAILHIRQNPCDNMPISSLAALCHVSESYFRARFRLWSGGISPTDYRNSIRIQKADELLASSLWTTELIAEELGFFDTSHFYRIYKKFTGHTPRLKGNK